MIDVNKNSLRESKTSIGFYIVCAVAAVLIVRLLIYNIGNISFGMVAPYGLIMSLGAFKEILIILFIALSMVILFLGKANKVFYYVLLGLLGVYFIIAVLYNVELQKYHMLYPQFGAFIYIMLSWFHIIWHPAFDINFVSIMVEYFRILFKILVLLFLVYNLYLFKTKGKLTDKVLFIVIICIFFIGLVYDYIYNFYYVSAGRGLRFLWEYGIFRMISNIRLFYPIFFYLLLSMPFVALLLVKKQKQLDS